MSRSFIEKDSTITGCFLKDPPPHHALTFFSAAADLEGVDKPPPLTSSCRCGTRNTLSESKNQAQGH